MRLNHNIDLGYCTNIHRGESWEETFASLENYTLEVMKRVCPQGPYGIGLRLSHQAAVELSQHDRLLEFERWLDRNHCYIFTINGFPYGRFHGTRVKEQVFSPDWTSSLRLDYTNLLFDLLSDLLPDGMHGSVSTLPGSFKESLAVGDSGGVPGGGGATGEELRTFEEFLDSDDPRLEAICQSIRLCAEYVAQLRDRTGQDLHLGLEPEPLGLFETSRETVRFFEHLVEGVADKKLFLDTVGVNYDTCHLAVEFEEAPEALGRLRDAGIRISKLHLSSALRLKPDAAGLDRLKAFQEDTYLHQVVTREGDGIGRRFRDLPPAFEYAEKHPDALGDEWRVHFHVPLHAPPAEPFGDTRDHIHGALEVLGEKPDMCSQLEMETYTWEVLPPEMHADDVVDQLEKEYLWTLEELEKVGLWEG